MSYHVVDQNGASLGFSLRPPKWVRKLKPGKFLLPAAAIIGTLLIPGVGGAIVGGVLASAKAIGGAAGSLIKGATTVGTALAPAAPIAKSFLAPGAPSSSASFAPMPSAPAPSPATVRTAGQPMASGQFPVVPVAIGLGLLLLATRRR